MTYRVHRSLCPSMEYVAYVCVHPVDSHDQPRLTNTLRKAAAPHYSTDQVVTAAGNGKGNIVIGISKNMSDIKTLRKRNIYQNRIIVQYSSK